MGDLNIQYSKVQDKDEAFQKVKAAITPETVERFKVKADFDYDDSSREIKAKGKGFELWMNFSENEAHVKLKLSMLLKPFHGKIMEGLEKQLKRVI